MSLVMESWESCKRKYKENLLKNPDLMGDLESGIRWISYLISSKTSSTGIFSELLYCASNLLVMFNDIILEHHMNSVKTIPLLPEDKIRKWLAAINCVEVFAEIASARFWGKAGKWIIITTIQILKTICRLVLIFKYKRSIVSTITSPTLNRKKVVEELHILSKDGISIHNGAINSIIHSAPTTYTLNSSGRIVRTMAAAPCPSERTWRIPTINSDNEKSILPELIYTFRPLTHLLSMGAFGERSWKPWLISGMMDVCSLQLMGEQTLSSAEQKEFNQRFLLLLFYLLRSPFYDKYTKKRLAKMLGCMRWLLPIGRFVWDPLLGYVHSWDKFYFYSWDP